MRPPYSYFSLLPFMASSLQMCFLLASYLVGIFYSGNIDHYVPFPSDLTCSYHEKGLFGIGMILGSMLGFSVVLLRYVQINGIYPRHCGSLNIFSFTIGVTMCCGQMLMVVYPNIKEVDFIHFIAARVYFLSACFYMFTQAQLTRELRHSHTTCVLVLRISCCVLATIGLIAYVVGRIATSESEKWYRIPHASEWLVIACTFVYMSTYCSDFNTVKFRSHKITDGIPYRNDNTRGTNYIDYLRNQSRSRKISDSKFMYHGNTKC